MPEKAVGGIILAAGLSLRMKKPKLLLPYDEKNCVIGATIEQALKAELDFLILVSGAHCARVEAVAREKGVGCVYNPDYAAGQSSSLKCGLDALGENMAAMFILGDQPQIPATVYRALAETYRRQRASIVVPRDASGERGNPSLFAPELFPELRQISGDVGGRPLLRKYIDRIVYVDIEGEDVLSDIDTAEQYKALTGRDAGE